MKVPILKVKIIKNISKVLLTWKIKNPWVIRNSYNHFHIL
jgi:hypothetical protein